MGTTKTTTERCESCGETADRILHDEVAIHEPLVNATIPGRTEYARMHRACAEREIAWLSR